MKELKKKYKGLGKSLTPDRLCGNKYYKNEMTVSKYLVALQIYRSWKNFQAIKKRQQDQRMREILQPRQMNFQATVFTDEIVNRHLRLVQAHPHPNEAEEAKLRERENEQRIQ
jgi:hypothetical protein